MFLIRHDAVAVRGICYGQTDIDAAIAYTESAQKVKAHLPATPAVVYSSPLKRCAKLAEACFPAQHIAFSPELMEVNFGDWEMKPWSEISRASIDRWAQSPTSFQFPNGEHLLAFQHRVEAIYTELTGLPQDTCVFTHGGVIRLMQALRANEPWQNWLQTPAPFAGVVELTG
ncbi:histidine phosphatase family protein [Reinekea marinisedimentorum]|uniref:histidine phosphatase family protein n=1 Tax=Reinekea marinisedimentorum TaxID=230495 RepID=UPI0014054C30|nr:histidine phosphatase family protein [Reinekea marinisedimentorum]